MIYMGFQEIHDGDWFWEMIEPGLEWDYMGLIEMIRIDGWFHRVFNCWWCSKKTRSNYIQLMDIWESIHVFCWAFLRFGMSVKSSFTKDFSVANFSWDVPGKNRPSIRCLEDHPIGPKRQVRLATWDAHPKKKIELLVGGLNPSEKYWSIGMIIPNIWENKIRVPNHQPGYNLISWVDHHKLKIEGGLTWSGL